MRFKNMVASLPRIPEAKRNTCRYLLVISILLNWNLSKILMFLFINSIRYAAPKNSWNVLWRKWYSCFGLSFLTLASMKTRPTLEAETPLPLVLTSSSLSSSSSKKKERSSRRHLQANSPNINVLPSNRFSKAMSSSLSTFIPFLEQNLLRRHRWMIWYSLVRLDGSSPSWSSKTTQRRSKFNGLFRSACREMFSWIVWIRISPFTKSTGSTFLKCFLMYSEASSMVNPLICKRVSKTWRCRISMPFSWREVAKTEQRDKTFLSSSLSTDCSAICGNSSRPSKIIRIFSCFFSSLM